MLPERQHLAAQLQAVPLAPATDGPPSVLRILREQGERALPPHVHAESIALDLECTVQTVHRMKKRGELPQPVGKIGRRERWATHIIVDHYRAIGLIAG